MTLCMEKLITRFATFLIAGLVLLPPWASVAAGAGGLVTCLLDGACSQVDAAVCEAQGGKNLGNALTCSDPMVFLDRAAAPGGNGSYQLPFQTLVETEAGAPDGAVVRILRDGNYPATNLILDRPLKLINQSLVGPAVLRPPIVNCQNAVDCNDNNGCTIDSCIPGVGCQYAQKICNIECLGGECDPVTGGCGPVLPVGTTCNDGNNCTFGDSCFYGTCSGTPCTDAQTCCPGEACVNLGMDNSNCGACGNVCENSVCFQGSCFSGCVISGVGYLNGARNPNNVCQICDVSVNRTEWQPLNLLDDPGNPFGFECQLGDCFRGYCVNGACSSFAGVTPGCPPASTCATYQCHPVSQQCILTPQNQGAACTPPLVNNGCRSSTQGTCQSGSCVASPDNEGEYCIPVPITGIHAACYSGRGTCDASGTCTPERLNDGAFCGYYGTNCGICFTLLSSGFFGCHLSEGSIACPCMGGLGNPAICNPEGVCLNIPNDEIDCHEDNECCRGMVCICHPYFPQSCTSKTCWNLTDID